MKRSYNVLSALALSTRADYARLQFVIGALVANTAERPRWNEGGFLGEKFAR